jgi:hypothetical protein
MDRKVMNSITINMLRWLFLTYDLTTWNTNLIEAIFQDSVSISQKTHTKDVLKTDLLLLFSETSFIRANNAQVGTVKFLINKNYSRLTLMNIVGYFFGGQRN